MPQRYCLTVPAEAASSFEAKGDIVAEIENGGVERLIALPGFVEAARASAKAMSELYRGAPLLNAVVNDRGRLVIASMALYLHFLGERDPDVKLTAGRLKAHATAQGVCSAGRAAAVIALMRWGGYLASAPAEPGERSERLAATPKLLEMAAERWSMQLRAMSGFLPEAGEILERLNDPRFAAAFAIAQGEEFFSGFRFVDQTPELEPFFDRNGGLLILFSLVAQGSGQAHAAAETATISISGLARRFGVSRPHVIALFRDAQDRDLLERQGDQLRLGEGLRAAIDRFFGLVYLFNLTCGRQAAQACRG
jgi:hypothetical protein